MLERSRLSLNRPAVSLSFALWPRRQTRWMKVVICIMGLFCRQVKVEHCSNVQTSNRCQLILKMFVVSDLRLRPRLGQVDTPLPFLMQQGNRPRPNRFSARCWLPLCSLLDRPSARLRLQ